MLIIFYGTTYLAGWNSSLYLHSDITALTLLQQGGVNRSPPLKVSGNQNWSTGRKQKEAEREQGMVEREREKGEGGKRGRRKGGSGLFWLNKKIRMHQWGKCKLFFFPWCLPGPGGLCILTCKIQVWDVRFIIYMPPGMWHHLVATHKTSSLRRQLVYLHGHPSDQGLQQHKQGRDTDPTLKIH